MADNIQRSEYPSAKMPTVLEVNTDTGAAILYRNNYFLGRIPIARSEPSSNGKWTITDKFAAEYNFSNGTKLTTKEAQQVFTKTLAKQSNNERAAIINKHTPPNAKTYMSTVSKIPGVIDPKTKTKTEDTTETPTIADTPPEAGDTSKPSSEPPKSETKTRNDFGEALHYPVTRDPKQDVIKFDMLKYEPKKISGFGFGERDSTRESIGTVTLPIPGGLSDSNACNWGDDTMGPLQLAAAGAALKLLTPDGSTPIGAALGDLKSQLVTNNTEMKQLIQGKFAASAVGADPNSLLSRTQGMILNPNLELLFQGPSLRPFAFEFKMSPRSAAEAKLITQIIRFFKQGMAPIREESRLFLKTPHTFRIKYVQMGSQEESKFLNKFKECALLSCSVQYTPEGNYAPYEDGAMSSYQMSLQFKELEPVYNDNYSSDPVEIGF
jgi:hypothetical protein